MKGRKGLLMSIRSIITYVFVYKTYVSVEEEELYWYITVKKTKALSREIA